ncbi:hypothetical protein SAMN05216360_10661 [Methylobacterium phyllostachyos]|uniref:DUF2946 family protein n=2 Tax=Methylobacterium phyllostachyos TaxID=582672 RepID=A0A1G9Z184_9HYPH|nr:hypothetical protein SAMN05216360_10661 [Methylobacterium phyllostachyos]
MVEGRAIMGVIALYALLLQAFLGFAAPARLLPSPETVLCADHVAGEPDTPAVPVHVHACCTLVQAVALTQSDTAWTGVPLPAPAAARLVWRPEAEILRTGPPPRPSTARGPPGA